MNEKEFLEMKERIRALEKKSAEANGKLEAIKERWQKEYGFSDVESARKKLEEMKADILRKTEKRDELFGKLRTLMNGNAG